MTPYAELGGHSGHSSDGGGGYTRRANRISPKDAIHGGQATYASSVINLLNTIVGAGTLAMGLAMSHLGLTIGTLVIIWSALMAGFGLYLQYRCSRYLERGSASFFALSQMTYPSAAIIFDAAIAIKCFGVGVSYLIIIGDLMPGVIRGINGEADEMASFLISRRFWITAFMLIVIPLAFLRRLDSLKYTSVVALVSISYLVVLVVYHYAAADTLDRKGPVRFFAWGGPIEALASFPVLVFAYTCHQNMFSILNELRNDSPAQVNSVVWSSTGIAAFIYILVGITGYLSFGDNVEGNLVRMYLPSLASTVGKAAIVVLVMFSYPLQVHPCRASIDAVLRWRLPSSKAALFSVTSQSPSRARLLGDGSTRRPASPPRTDAIPELRFAILTTIIIILSYIAAMTVTSLDKVLAYVGSTGSTSISFILPGLFYYKISNPAAGYREWSAGKDDDDASLLPTDVDGSGRPSAPWHQRWLRKAALGLAVYGAIVMIVCLSANIFFHLGGH